VEYSLTDLGEQLVPAINAIADVGLKLKERRGVLHGAGKPRAKRTAAE
jgi:DNA-binding HxlR family transcriptional regulator